MDKTVTIAGVVAVIAIIGVTLLLNPFGSPKASKAETPVVEQPSEEPGEEPSGPTTTPTIDEEDDDEPAYHDPDDDINYVTANYGVIPEEIQGDCTLYQHVADDNKYACFGTAGNFSTMATNEYMRVECEEYFCKPTKYGCKLYQRVIIRKV